MNRFPRIFGPPFLIFVACALAGCGSSSTKTVFYPTPANVQLTPSLTSSMDVGSTLVFTAQPQDLNKTSITEPFSFFSNNPAVVTIAANGTACAGTWDSLSNPQVCTPGPVGVAQITASAQGVNSPPTTLYVHERIDNISVGPLTTQSNPSVQPCVSKGNTFQFSASAFSHGRDITSTVGQFGWQTTNSSVANVTTQTSGSTFLNQVQVTAGVPGVSSIFASVGGVNGVPFNFVTCPVQSITLSVNGTNSTFLALATGASQTITATVTDSLRNVITGVPLTWTSSNPISVAVAAGAVNTGTISTSAAGGSSIVASCMPLTCNIGFQPSLPIYPQASIGVAVSQSGTVTGASGTLYVTSSDCNTNAGCVSTLVQVAVPGNTVGTAIILPSTPNSIIFSRDGTSLYLGTDFGDLGTRGLMKYTASTTTPSVTQNTSIVGKVVAISPDGSKAIVSDLADPNSARQVFVYDTSSNSAITVSTPGATTVAADFSPDSFKAFIVASSGSASTLYVYSKVDALQTIPLTAPSADVAFLPSGNFGYIADAPASQLTIAPTCDNPPPGTSPAVLTAPAIAPPSLIRPIIDGRMLTLEPSGVEIFSPTVSGDGCAFPRPYPGSSALIPGTLAVTNTSTFFNLGQGNFLPAQLIVSPDGSKAYILGKDSNQNPLSVLFVFDIINHTSSAISLAGNAIPLQAALTPDGTVLYVGASDGTVHAVNTSTTADSQQISFPLGLCRNATGASFGGTCNPDVLAVKP